MERVILSGYTPRPKDERLLPHVREKLDQAIHKTALGAEEMLEINSSGDIISDLEKLRMEGWQIVGLENNLTEAPNGAGTGGKNSGERRFFRLNEPELRLAEQVVLILGEEVEGIDYSLHEIIDLFVEIPMRGRKESFNVSVATGIALYAIMNL